jgi:hypothetical protein
MLMNETEELLYRRICACSFEGGEMGSFVQKLASENGWSFGYTKRAIDEYRRFMFLAVASGHPVAPSDQVDQVWHLHLTYTRAYWDHFCESVLGQRVHHSPSQGGAAESQKFVEWYDDTLRSYRRLFGERPPPEIWPQTRFGRDLSFMRINTGRHWVIRKPPSGMWTWAGALGVAVAVAAVPGRHGLGVATAQFEVVRENLYGVTLTVVVALIFVLGFVFQRRCTRCGRFWVFRASGFSDEGGRYSRDEWECDSCGHREWKRRSSGGGSGCGASGGCGGGCGGD